MHRRRALHSEQSAQGQGKTRSGVARLLQLPSRGDHSALAVCIPGHAHCCTLEVKHMSGLLRVGVEGHAEQTRFDVTKSSGSHNPCSLLRVF